ncbi:hypothetical protein BH10BAC5_BH10BAC5_13520 [soil metagenome]
MNRIFLGALLILISQSLYAQRTAEITTVLKEEYKDKTGHILTGKGITIGDVDSGLDIFHPMFFFADGGEYSWIDTDKDNKFTPGTDQIVLTVKGKKQNIYLNYLEIKNNVSRFIKSDPTEFNPDMDFIYADLNNDGKREYGINTGFTEQDPSYGEPLFIAIDKNKNGKLDVGEKLIALKTSKIKAYRQMDGTVRRRGKDLIETKLEETSHCTGVAGILLGGTYGVQKLHGIAPDAELVLTQMNYDFTPRFVKNFSDHFNFLKDEGADIIQVEDGEFSYEYMDGSSADEQLLTDLTKNGKIVFTATGNLAVARATLVDTLRAGESSSFTFTAPSTTGGKKNVGVYVTYLWTGNSQISFSMTAPDKSNMTFAPDGDGSVRVGDYNIEYNKSVSSKGTSMYRFGISHKDSSDVHGKWEMSAVSDENIVLIGYINDISQSWAGETHFDKLTSRYNTVTYPSTADSTIKIGAYSVNDPWNDRLGQLASYSGRGYLVNGQLGIDIVAPGHSTFSTSPGNAYNYFSGTSSAMPHAAGLAALMLQYNRSLTNTEIRQILINSADVEDFMGQIPNADYGYGKLNMDNAIKYLMNNY